MNVKIQITSDVIWNNLDDEDVIRTPSNRLHLFV